MRPLPFGIRAHFDIFLVLIYAVEKEKAEALLPAPFVHETFGNNAIMAVAFVKTRNFRPAFIPVSLGINFNLAGFRHMATYLSKSGKLLRGLKIIRSYTNRKIMVRGGDKLTQYKFQYNPISITKDKEHIYISGDCIDIKAKKSPSAGLPELPNDSVFDNWSQARKFAGPLLYTFEVANNRVSITEGTRKNWRPKPAAIVNATIPFFTQSPYENLNPILSAAYFVRNIPYSWKKAVNEKL